jgi:hypothetical protein
MKCLYGKMSRYLLVTSSSTYASEGVQFDALLNYILIKMSVNDFCRDTDDIHKKLSLNGLVVLYSHNASRLETKIGFINIFSFLNYY